MTEQYLNIAITGLSIHHSEELKTQLRNLIPQEYKIKWSTAADPTIDCLFIHENFYETDGIQKIIQSRNFPWLKITKNNNNENILQENRSKRRDLCNKTPRYLTIKLQIL